MQYSKKIDLVSSIIKLREDGIMQINIKRGVDLTLDHVIEITDTIGESFGGKSFPNLIYIDYFINPDTEVRAYSASEAGNKYTIADAFIVNSTALKLIGNVYVAFNKPVRPTRIFTDDKFAIEWLKSFL